MRSLSPAFVLTSVVIALASTAAAAQSAPAGTRLIGTNGSTATATTTNNSGTSAGSTTGASSTPSVGNTLTAPNNATGTTNNATGTTNNATGTTNNSTGTTNNSTGTTNNATGPLNNATGPLLTTPGSQNQTGPLSGLVNDPGTTAITGTAPSGASGTNTGNGTNTNNNNGFAGGIIGGFATDAGALGDSGSGVNANGERVAGGGNTNAANNGSSNGAAPNTITMGNTTANLPLYDATTKAATARDLRRRANRQEPRIYGLAPRTDADLTHQMPDDRIIRY